LSIYLFLTMYYFYFSMNASRQFMAIVIVANAYYFAKRQKLIPFSILIFLAYSIHTTALFGVLLYLIFLFRPKLNRIIYIFIIGFISLVLLDPIMRYIGIIFPKYNIYIGSSAQMSGGIMTLVVYSAIFLFGLMSGIRKNEKYNSHLIIAAIAALLGIMGMFSEVLNRPAWYFDVFSIIIIPSIIKSGFENRAKPLIYFSVIATTLFYNLYYFNYNWHYVLPYKFFWEF
jgi:transmembrane protein EpsG